VRSALIACFVALLLACDVEAKTQRSYAAKSEFKRQQPCPATGQSKGSCPGWIIDHVIPLCAGGSDRYSNMQWQTVGDAKIKDRAERRICRIKNNEIITYGG
jgi:hypothetical protein